MEPSRKRRIRLLVALTAAVLLAGGLIYTSFSASSPAVTPSRLLTDAGTGRSYQLTGTVVNGSVHRNGAEMSFRVRDRTGTASVPVRYSGEVPDPFRQGREVIVQVRKQGDVFVGERDSLITKCPSKFTDKQNTPT
jgi:cytochrome c-type biogenesis protein CcmE